MTSIVAVVSDFLLLASDHRSMSNPTPLNMSICDAGKKVMTVLSDYKS